ncbi:MAG: hypothetical protein ACT4TC_06740 [Myxococcaceae bacterium]
MRSLIPSTPRPLLALSIAFAVSASAAPAKHRTDPAESHAKARFNEANKAYDLGQFEIALEAYSQAYRLKALPGLLFNIAQCHRQLGHFERAAFFYRRYLDLEKKPRDEETVRALLAEMEAKQKETLPIPGTTPKMAALSAPSAKTSSQRSPGRLESSAAPTSAHPSVELAAREPPLTQRWYFWTGVGAGVVTVTGIILWAAQSRSGRPTLADINARGAP